MFEWCSPIYEKYLKDNKHNSHLLARKYAWIFVLGSYRFLEALSVLQTLLSKTCCFSEQKISADKYPRIFSRQMQAIIYLYKVFTLANICIAKWRLGAWGIQELPLSGASAWIKTAPTKLGQEPSRGRGERHVSHWIDSGKRKGREGECLKTCS